MKLNIHLNGPLVTSAWRSDAGEVLVLGRDIDPGQVPAVLARTARFLRERLPPADQLKLDVELERLADTSIDDRTKHTVLCEAVYKAAEQLGSSSTVFAIDIGDAPPN